MCSAAVFSEWLCTSTRRLAAVGLLVAYLVLVVLYINRDGAADSDEGHPKTLSFDELTSPPGAPLVESVSELWPHYQARCSIPSWSAPYASLHRDIRAGNLPPSYLVSVGVEAGLGDRLIGLMTEFWISVLLNRALVMPPYVDGSLPMWEAGFAIRDFDWTFPVQRPELTAPLEFTYQGVRGYSPYKRAYDPAKVNVSIYQMHYLVNNGMSWSKYDMFLKKNISPRFGTAPYLFMSSNRGASYLLFNNSHYHARMRAMGMDLINLATCTFEAILAPSKATLVAYQGFMNAFTANPEAVRISVNFRAGDFVFTDRNLDKLNPELLSKLEPFFDCANQIATWEREARGASLAIVMYFTSESIAVRKHLDLVMRNRVVTERLAIPAEPFAFITDPSTEYYHGDCRKLVPGFMSMTREEQQSACPERDQNASIVHAAGQMYVMTQAHHHVFYASGFGILGAALSARNSGYWINIYLDKQQCSRGDARSPSDVAAGRSGM